MKIGKWIEYPKSQHLNTILPSSYYLLPAKNGVAKIGCFFSMILYVLQIKWNINFFFLYKAWCPSLSPNIKQYTIANCLALNIHIICHTRDLGFELSYCKCLQNVSFFPLLFPRWHCKTHLIHFVGPTCICCSQKVK